MAENNRGGDPIIRRKLKISRPGDAYEQEADRVAEHVMRMSSRPSDSGASVFTAKEEGIDRKCAACETKDKEQVKIVESHRVHLS
jgi:hypothetical protein